MSIDSTARFSSRVDDYAQFRPSYPPEAVELMRVELGIAPGAIVADVGSGTGIFTELLLDAGYNVRAIEPNSAMREAAEHRLGARQGFASIDGTAERTTLPDRSIDVVTAAQAYHWFDVDAARAEFARVLRRDGAIVLLWNDRDETGSEFAREYQALIDEFNTDLALIDHRRITRDDTTAIARLFGVGGFDTRHFTNHQDLDFEGLRGRLVSSSYILSPGEPRHDEMIERLRTLFERHNTDGRVRVDYVTRVYFGRPTS